MSLNRLQALVYLAVAVIIHAVGDLHGIGADPVLPVVAVADGSVVVGGLILGAASPADSGAVSPAVQVQVNAPQAPRGANCIGANRGGYGLLHGIGAGVGSFRGTGKEQDECEHGRGVA